MVYTLVSLSALNCLLCLVWKGSPRDSAQWPQKCNQPKSPHIIHLFSAVRSLSSLFVPFSHPNPHSVSTVVLPRLAYSLSLPSFFLSVSPELRHKHKEKGRELILQHCWVGLVLSYGRKLRGRGITRQICDRVYPPLKTVKTEQLLQKDLPFSFR